MKLSDPGAAAIIGAGAALAGVLLSSVVALVIDSRRRRWEDRRRWHDAKRHMYASFHYTVRRGIGAAGQAAALAIRRAEDREANEGGTSSGKPTNDATLERLERTVTAAGESVPEWGQRLNEASAEIDLIASGPVREAARAHYQVFADAFGLIRASLDGPMSSAELRARMAELDSRHPKTEAAFRRAVAAELGVERRRWWQFWKR
jgi:hypothetical protein